jgi:hypothetical protein
MIVIDESRPSAAADFKDPWADWKPLWTGKKRAGKNAARGSMTVQDVQERHSPTERVSVRLTAERQAHTSQRRITDARLWDAMTPAQQDAAIEIAIAFEVMGRGIGYTLSNWQRLPGSSGQSNVSEAHARLVKFYIDWARTCGRRHISHAMIIDVLCFGFSCRMLDHDRRQKTGATRENLMQGLALYCELRGWGE